MKAIDFQAMFAHLAPQAPQAPKSLTLTLVPDQPEPVLSLAAYYRAQQQQRQLTDWFVPVQPVQLAPQPASVSVSASVSAETPHSQPAQPAQPAQSGREAVALLAGQLIASRYNLPSNLGLQLTKIRNPRAHQPGQPEFLYLDSDQLQGLELALAGSSFVIAGEAGFGKTTLLQAIVLAKTLQLRAQGKHSYSFKPRGSKQRYHCPPIAIVTFTNKAVGVLRQKVLSNPDVVALGNGHNIQTCHALLEFAPEYVWSEKQQKEVRVFKPQRTANWPLHGLQTIIIDEASMVGVNGVGSDKAMQIWSYLYAALQQGTQVILVGDINQLPPVGGKSVLSYGLQQLPILQLKHFHRQAAESPVLKAAHSILRGKFPEALHNPATGDYCKFIFSSREQERLHKGADYYNVWLGKAVERWIESGSFNPETDVFLLPYNKRESKDKRYGYVNTEVLNNHIGTHLALQREEPVWTVQAGFMTHRLAVGDKLLVDKQEAVVTAIKRNASYWGKWPANPEVGLDYETGKSLLAARHSSADEVGEPESEQTADAWDLEDMNSALEKMLQQTKDSTDQTPEAQQQASHVVDYYFLDDPEQTVFTLSTTGDFQPANYQLGYALTAHKAQGSEWDKVVVVLHPSHSKMASREWLYTACTRARSKLVLLGLESVFRAAVASPRIKGSTLQEKIAYFNGGYIEPTDFAKLAQSESQSESQTNIYNQPKLGG